MNRGPRRLLEDPDFLWETGCDLADERLQVGEYDLAGMKSSVLAQVAVLPAVTVGDGIPGVRSGSVGWTGVKPLASVIAGAAIIATAFWLGTKTAGDAADIPVDTVVEAPLAAPAATVVPAAGLRAPVMSAPPSASAPKGAGDRVPAPPVAVRPAPAGSSPAAVVAAEASTPEVEGSADETVSQAAVPDEAPAPAAGTDVDVSAPSGNLGPTSSLPEQLKMYDPASDALTNGRFEEAASGFRHYLDAWPDGVMRREAQLGLLHALFGAGDASGTEALAATLQQRSEFAPHREDILRLQADALVVLGQCDEAMALADGLTPRAAVQVRRACRLVRRK